MHIMVNKRYMRKCDTCVGHEARMNKLLFKEAPRFNERRSALKRLVLKEGGKRRENKDSEKI